MKWILHSCLYCYFQQAHFVMFSGLLFIRFVEAVVCFCKDENIAIYLLIHTKLAPILEPFFCVLPSLQFEKLKHCPISLMLD